MKDCAGLAEHLVADEPALLSSLDFGPFVAQGTGAGPALLIGDQSEISLLMGRTGQSLDYRMSHLARPGDIVLVRRRHRDFETYLADHAGLEHVTFLEMTPPDTQSVAQHARACPSFIERMSQIAAQNGGLTIKSYLTTGNIWRLAQTIGEAAGHVVHVHGPSPRLTTRCNDKLWFTQLARSVLGRDATPPTLSAYGPAATAALVSRISKLAPQVVVKVPDSAGSAGNVRASSAQLAGETITDVRNILMDRLHATGWHDRYPVLVGVWDDNVTCSPSVQLWIPRMDAGGPIAEGVFEQSVMGETAAFVGAARSSLPQSVQRKLVSEAQQIAAVLQNVGYYGRCSFDAVICGADKGQDKFHWIECNGRWGGVSIPMSAVAQSDTLRSFEGLLIVQELLPDRSIDTPDMLNRLDDLLHHHHRPADGIILLSPPSATRDTMVNFMVVSKDQATARELGDQAMRRLRSSA